MSNSTGRYNHQAHMVFHKFTWCMKHLGAQVHLIHLTQYNRLLIPYHLKVNVRQKIGCLQEQDQEIAETRPEKNCKHHTQDIVTYSRTVSWNYEDIWKRRTWCSFLTWGMSDSLGRYNHQAHMVFHKFTYCMKHLEGNMHMIHLTL